jgi:hypothetical protein
MNFDPAGTGLTGKFAKRYHFEDMPDQVGKTAIVTGGSAGIGQSIALAMALAGATGEYRCWSLALDPNDGLAEELTYNPPPSPFHLHHPGARRIDSPSNQGEAIRIRSTSVQVR